MKTKKEEVKEKKRCPEGLELGADFDKYYECGTCKIWEDCKNEAKRELKP